MPDQSRVLIIDDNEDMLRIFSYVIQGATGEVACIASSAAEGLEKIEAAKKNGWKFDLILLDIQMPEIDGLQAAQSIKNAGFEGLIVAFTANANGEGRKKAIDAGIDAYFDKRYLKKNTISMLLDQACKRTE